jgi:hypothetical protein
VRRVIDAWREPSSPARRAELMGDGGPAPTADYRSLRQLLLTDGVSRSLFQGFEQHRAGVRGEEETGWVLLGIRNRDDAIALATLPAGTERDASVGHVRFHAAAQAIGSRMVRQSDRRLTILGVVHTHPGSLRHPSSGDLRGDSTWVGQLRGHEGVFGIGTADAAGEPLFARQPKSHVQILGSLRFSWYALAKGDEGYRTLPVGLTLGPDLARDLHPVWATIEAHADRLDRLARQQAKVGFEVTSKGELAMTLPLAEPGDALRVLLSNGKASYFLMRQGDILAADPGKMPVDQAIYSLLTELAARS